MDTKYLIECTGKHGTIEKWHDIPLHGQSMTAASLHVIDLKQLFPDYKYSVRPVSAEEVEERVVMA